LLQRGIVSKHRAVKTAATKFAAKRPQRNFRITVMKTNKGSAVLSALLYAQVLFGVAAISAVLLREQPAPTAVDRMAVASISNSQSAESR
jgi:hypothetical protein